MKKDYLDWFEKNYHELSGCGLWFRGGELNTFDADDFDRSDYKILISRLSTSRDTADSITHKIIYQLARGVCGTFVDLTYLPPPKDSQIFDRDQIPWMIGTSSKRDALQFDMIAISNSIVQELVNIGTILKKSNIPLSKKERVDRADIPLIILGGANALNTSLLLGDNPVVDGIFAGEDPELIERIFLISRDLKMKKKPKCEILEELNSIPGFFQPDQKRMTSKHFPASLSRKSLLCNAPVFYEEEQPGKAKLQISEGCPCFCSFCSESWIRKPYREFDSTVLLPHASEMKASMGLESVELYSFNFSMHSEFYSLLWNLHSQFSSVGLKSQRFDFFAQNHELPRILQVASKSSITCGLEGISSRLRAYLHKSLTERDLRSGLNLLLRTAIRELKIFLIATGLENEQDFEEFRIFLSDINELMVSAGRRPRIIFSLTPLVRFPFTPLEFEAAPQIADLKKIIEQIERLVKCRGFEFRSSCELQEYVLSQFICRADNPLIFEAIMQACSQTGFIYYQEVGDEFMNCLKQKLTDSGISPQNLLCGCNWTEKSRVPVQLIPDFSFLSVIRDNCSKFEDGGYCMGSYEQEGECIGCGACKDQSAVEKMISLRNRTSYTPEKLKAKIQSNIEDSVSLSFKVEIPAHRRGIPRKIVAMALSRALMLSDKRLVEGYRGFDDSLIQQRFGWPWIHGLDWLSLKWSSKTAAIITQLIQEQPFFDNLNRELENWCYIYPSAQLGSDNSLKLSMSSFYNFDCSSYLRKNSLKSTVYKNDSGAYCYQFTPQSIKKKIITALETFHEGDLYKVLILPGDKFILSHFLEDCFNLPSENGLVRINIRAS